MYVCKSLFHYCANKYSKMMYTQYKFVFKVNFGQLCLEDHNIHTIYRDVAYHYSYTYVCTYFNLNANMQIIISEENPF